MGDRPSKHDCSDKAFAILPFVQYSSVKLAVMSLDEDADKTYESASG